MSAWVRSPSLPLVSYVTRLVSTHKPPSSSRLQQPLKRFTNATPALTFEHAGHVSLTLGFCFALPVTSFQRRCFSATELLLYLLGSSPPAKCSTTSTTSKCWKTESILVGGWSRKLRNWTNEWVIERCESLVDCFFPEEWPDHQQIGIHYKCFRFTPEIDHRAARIVHSWCWQFYLLDLLAKPRKTSI